MTLTLLPHATYGPAPDAIPESVDDLRATATMVDAFAGPRMARAALRVGQRLVINPVHPIFVPHTRQRLWCHAWKIVSHVGVTFSLDITMQPGDDCMAVRVNGRTTHTINGCGGRAAEMLAAQVALALDAWLPEVA